MKVKPMSEIEFHSSVGVFSTECPVGRIFLFVGIRMCLAIRAPGKLNSSNVSTYFLLPFPGCTIQLIQPLGNWPSIFMVLTNFCEVWFLLLIDTLSNKRMQMYPPVIS